MLQVKNLTKIYKPKKGAQVRALDGINLTFPEKGMVFLLGKSGSGKSTLLNVCGGLDNPTEGEVIVKGKSSKDFAQSDFDSYRNTFVGFIFQEYNILNEFSVEDNIALALELQGKAKDKAAIAALLEQVDLSGFAKRKPGTLSGGQKQRIAIARALIKNPEIIMADEPTGALDSNTGKQVFDTLKKLSKNKLVIIVSHDRDFAEEYGDRIIELKDGKVISDVSKAKEQQVALSANINTVGEVLCIKNGADLTDNDFAKIKDFLKGSKKDIVIATDEKDVDNFKKVSKISDDGSKEVFKETKEGPAKEYSKEDSKFISSKLPLRHAIKIGLSGLKSKPFRLILTILLCTVAFTMFGLLTTLNFYDSETTFKETLAVTTQNYIKLDKQYMADVQTYINGNKDYDYEIAYDGRFGEEELGSYKTSLSPDTFGVANSNVSYNVRSAASRYWITSIKGVGYLEEGNALRNSIIGEYPQKNTEIAITSYAAQMLYTCGTYDSTGVNIELASPEAIIGEKINIGGSEYTVTGIIDSGVIDPQYEAILNGETDDRLLLEYDTYMADSIHLYAFTTYEEVGSISERNHYVDEGIFSHTHIEAVGYEKGEAAYNGYMNAVYKYDSMANMENYIPVSGNSIGADNQVIVNAAMLSSVLNSQTSKLYENPNLTTDADYQKLNKFLEKMNSLQSGVLYEYIEGQDKPKETKLTFEEIKQYTADVIKQAKEYGMDFRLGIKLGNPLDGASYGDGFEFEIVGVVVEGGNGMSCVYMNQAKADELWESQKVNIEHYTETTTEYVEESGARYSEIVFPYAYTEEAAQTLWEIFKIDEFNDEHYKLGFSSSFIANLKTVDKTVKELSKTFLIIGIILAVFAVLLFSNFISASISQKTRDIGILRAVGAKGNDVFKIFFSESFVIALICTLLSLIASNVLCSYLNVMLTEGLGAKLLTFGVMSVVVLVAIALFTVIVSTFLPVYNAARKKPVDSIRSL